MSNKFAFGGRSMFNQGKTAGRHTFYFGKVENNKDEFDTGVIKVRIKNVDDKIVEPDDLPNCFPLLQKFIHIKPKIGETVMVFVPDAANEFTDRVYIGPIISQPQFLGYDNHFYTSRSAFDTGLVEPKEAPSTVPENKGVYPNNDDIAIQGRGNSDIILKKNEVVIRAGKFVDNENSKEVKLFNKKNPAYIQLRNDERIDAKDESKRGTVANVVANKINLLTHADGRPNFILNDQSELITEEAMVEILENAHPLVFGDLLIQYLKLQRAAFINHVHPYHGRKPQDLAGVSDIDDYLDFDLDRLISKNVRTN